MVFGWLSRFWQLILSLDGYRASTRYQLHPGSGPQYCEEQFWACLSVNLWVFLSTRISQKPHIQTSPSLHMLSVAMAQSSYGGIVMNSVFPVLWMMLCFPVMGHMAVCHYSSNLAAVVLVAYCPRRRQPPRQDKSFMQGVPGQSMRCLVIEMDLSDCDWTIKWSLFDQIVPMAGPFAGGTKVTVTGENLGRGSTDTHITIGGQECIITHVDEFIRCVFLYCHHTHVLPCRRTAPSCRRGSFTSICVPLCQTNYLFAVLN